MRLLVSFLAFPLTALAIESVFAEPPSKSSSSIPTRPSYTEFIRVLNTNGQKNHIRTNIAPLLALAPNAPTKTFLIDNIDPTSPQEPVKSCNVLTGDITADSNAGLAIFLNGRSENTNLIVSYYKADRRGDLLLAVHAVIKRDEKKQPIRGSGKATTLDVTSPTVQRDFKKELDFWLSGKYKQYLKPAAEKAVSENATFREK